MRQLITVLWSRCLTHTHLCAGKHTCPVRALPLRFALSKQAFRFSHVSEQNRNQNQNLDIWKSVMRSGSGQEKGMQQDDDDDDEDDVEGDDVQMGSSSLQATRELVEMWRLAGKLVPDQLSDDQLQTLSGLETKSAKKKYLKHLALKERHKRLDQEKKERKRSERMARDEEEEEEGGKLRNTFVMRLWQRSLDTAHNWRAAQAMRFGQPLVFDMGFEQNQSRQELEGAVSQLLESEGQNRRAGDPFHLHYCNLQPGGSFHRQLLRRYGQQAWERLLVTSTSQSHVEVFPRGQLVYLTADSPNVLRSFDHSKVYIVGAIVDKSIQTGLTLACAKRLRISTARLPLDLHLHWDSGSKNLTLDQMTRILLSLKAGGPWEEALQFVPRRKHEGFYQRRSEEDKGFVMKRSGIKMGQRRKNWDEQKRL